MRMPMAVVGAVLVDGLVSAQGPALSAASCERLAASLRLPNTTVTSAKAVAAGRFVPPDKTPATATLPAFCRVQLTISPSNDSDIKSEVWLPLSGWNGRFQQVGNGAWGGSIQYAPLAAALARGYSAASTDTGHTGRDASFAMGHPEKLIDFGYRSVHETAVQSKATIAALYGSAPRVSYFNGCSGGGRQAFMEAQRYPADFDGLIAGAPGYDRTVQSFQLVAAIQATHKDPASYIPAGKYAVLHRAALEACDALDGATDGLISDPPRCRFDPAVTMCQGADGADCLTRAQVETAKTLYAPLTDPKTGLDLFPGFEPGSEPQWAVSSGGPRPLGMSDDLFKYVVFKDPQWDFRSLDAGRHLAMANAVDGGIVSPTSPSIGPFVNRGGKLLMYHGWADANISPRSSVRYYDRLVETLGRRAVGESVRLYMVPGMGHCGGGQGPDTFDMVAAIEQWREQGRAPAAIVASRIAGGRVERTRPVCPYPQVVRYKGTGPVDRAESFTCAMP